jgi:hypothetical protein
MIRSQPILYPSFFRFAALLSSASAASHSFARYMPVLFLYNF